MLPAAAGIVVWISPRKLEYQHPTLQTNTIYEVVLLEGYKDLAGNAYALRHHWSFTTERPPAVAASTPANNEGGVDPASYMSIDFSRQMHVSTLAEPFTIDPAVP